MIGAIVHQLTRNLNDEQVREGGFAPYFVDHTIGFPLRSLWSEFFHCHVLVELPGQGLRFELTGRALPGEYDIQAPASVMRDEDIDALATIFEAVRSLLAFVQELAGAAQ